jgi:hypothetical protein
MTTRSLRLGSPRLRKLSTVGTGILLVVAGGLGAWALDKEQESSEAGVSLSQRVLQLCILGGPGSDKLYAAGVCGKARTILVQDREGPPLIGRNRPVRPPIPALPVNPVNPVLPAIPGNPGGQGSPGRTDGGPGSPISTTGSKPEPLPGGLGPPRQPPPATETKTETVTVPAPPPPPPSSEEPLPPPSPPAEEEPAPSSAPEVARPDE